MVARRILPGLLLALAACSAAGPRPTAPAQDQDLAVTAEIDYSSPAVEGEIASFEVRIANRSGKYAILRDLAEPGSGSVASWQISMPGTLDFNEKTGDFEYDPARPSATPRPAFNVALLLPGEELLIRPKIRLLRLPRTCTLNYALLDKSMLSEQVYFEVREERRIRYRRRFGEDLDRALAPSDRARAATHRTVVYPHAESVLDTPRQASVKLDARVDRRPFPLQDAALRASTTPAEVGDRYTFSSALDGWIFRTPKGLACVSPQRVTPLPEIGNLDAFFFTVDSLVGGTLIFEIRSPLEVRLSQPEHALRLMETGTFPNRYSLATSRQDLPRLFQVLVAEGLRIDLSQERGGTSLLIRR